MGLLLAMPFYDWSHRNAVRNKSKSRYSILVTLVRRATTVSNYRDGRGYTT